MQAIKYIKTNSKLFILTGMTCFLIIALTLNAIAQAGVKAIKINDTLPDIIVQNLIRKPTFPMHTRQLYKDGLLLINFWATWCAPCQTELQMLAKEVEKNPKIRVLSVGYESRTIVDAYLGKHPELANSKLEFMSDDKYFIQAFFHQGLPHNIWVDSKGVVMAITSGDEVTPMNLANFLKNSANNFYEKKEVPFDFRKPAHIPDSLLTYRAVFSKTLPGVTMGGASVPLSKMGKPTMTRFFCFNNFITYLFWKAWQMPGNIPTPDLFEIQTADSSRFFWPGKGRDPSQYTGPIRSEWERNNSYTYEFQTPRPITDSIFFHHVIEDLELNLNLKTTREKRLKNCIIMTCDTADERIRSMKAPDDKFYLGPLNGQLIIKNVPLNVLLDWISRQIFTKPRKEPYINQTNLNFLVTANLDLGKDLEKGLLQDHIEKSLSEKLGFSFTPKTTMFPVLVIRDAKE